MSKPHIFYLFAVLTFAIVSIFFLVNHYVEKNTDTVASLDTNKSDSSIKTEIVSEVKTLASVPEEFSLENYRDRLISEEAKLLLRTSSIRGTFPQNKGDPYSWSPFEDYLVEGTVDSIQRSDNS